MKRFIRHNALGLVLVTTFLLVWLVGQTTAGLHVYNQQRIDAGLPTVRWSTYLTTAHFGEATFENWESEFLQMAMFVVLTVKLRQWGSAESKPLEGETEADEDPRVHRDDPDAPWPVRRGGWAGHLSAIVVGRVPRLFLGSFALHAVTGVAATTSNKTCPAELIIRPAGRICRVAVLVRVAPELAIRVPRGRRHRAAVDRAATAGLARIETCPRTEPTDGGVGRCERNRQAA